MTRVAPFPDSLPADTGEQDAFHPPGPWTLHVERMSREAFAALPPSPKLGAAVVPLAVEIRHVAATADGEFVIVQVWWR